MDLVLAFVVKSLLIAGVTLGLLKILAHRSAAERSMVAHFGLLALLIMPVGSMFLPQLVIEAPAMVSAGEAVPPAVTAPAVTAECAAPFLLVGGLLMVAEPPGGDGDRWPSSGLARLGLTDDGVVTNGEATVRRLRARQPCDPEYPRDEAVQKAYTTSAKSPEAWAEFRAAWVDIPEDEYQRKVREAAA